MVQRKMDNRISQALVKLFERHRIVFWYDPEKELRNEFEALAISDIEKIEIDNNEFGLKYRLLRQEPEQKFLLYCEGPQPDDIDNWLLDVLLAHGQFRTDRAGLWLSELGLGIGFTDLIVGHEEFFRAERRLKALKRMLRPEDSRTKIRLKMLAVCAGSDPAISSILENLLDELAEEKNDKTGLIRRCSLDGFLWQQLERHYGYVSPEPGIMDFALHLFKSCYFSQLTGGGSLTADALVFLKRWKDSRRFEQGFEKLSTRCAEMLDIEKDLEQRDFRELLEIDYFRLVDQKIISDLVKEVAGRTASFKDVAAWIDERRRGHWYRDFKDLYEAISQAAIFRETLDSAVLEMAGMEEGIRKYSTSWYMLDQIYRKFIFHVCKAGQASITGELMAMVEDFYANNFMLSVNDRWQACIDKIDRWNVPGVLLQKDFYKSCILPFIKKRKKVCIIISDALRFEIGQELTRIVRQEDRFSAQIEPALSMLPSYTQLGMAALLPNRELAMDESGNGAVLVDGKSSQGLDNRRKIIQDGVPCRATALKAEEFMGMKKTECRRLVKDHDIIYIFHNRIDATGDKRESEDRVFEAAEETLRGLLKLLKKLAGANVSNMAVTADHGFIYQHKPIDESDFSGAVPEGKEILYQDRRFIIGRGLREVPGLKKFSSSMLGLSGSLEVLIPKSINRLRLKGSGSRFVHGGAALQEVVIPVIRINKKRKSDVGYVDVEILRDGKSVITSAQFAVILYQVQPVSDKILPRTLRAGIYNQDGKLISDRHELAFDSASDNSREREKKVRFLLTREADEANGREVILKLEERLPGTSHYKEYKSATYVMRRSFTSDFDF